MRQERLPSLTAREHWGSYVAGMLAEAAYVLALVSTALLVAVVAKAIWR